MEGIRAFGRSSRLAPPSADAIRRPAQLKANAVTSAKVRNGSLLSADFSPASFRLVRQARRVLLESLREAEAFEVGATAQT